MQNESYIRMKALELYQYPVLVEAYLDDHPDHAEAFLLACIELLDQDLEIAA